MPNKVALAKFGSTWGRSIVLFETEFRILTYSESQTVYWKGRWTPMAHHQRNEAFQNKDMPLWSVIVSPFKGFEGRLLPNRLTLLYDARGF